MERRDAPHRGGVEGHDVRKGEAHLVLVEEKGRPGEVEGEVHCIDSEGQRLRRQPALLEHQPRRNPHGRIDCSPHRAEDPVWGVPRRLFELHVPVLHVLGRAEPLDHAHAQGDRNEGHGAQGAHRGAHDRPCISKRFLATRLRRLPRSPCTKSGEAPSLPPPYQGGERVRAPVEPPPPRAPLSPELRSASMLGLLLRRGAAGRPWAASFGALAGGADAALSKVREGLEFAVYGALAVKESAETAYGEMDPSDRGPMVEFETRYQRLAKQDLERALGAYEAFLAGLPDGEVRAGVSGDPTLKELVANTEGQRDAMVEALRLGELWHENRRKLSEHYHGQAREKGEEGGRV
mmetsp:Transcript_34924/g.110330  ORF Transcript_34924/g.110330 Transcript_34924/m.110330 type:complete len:349 (+) Transcript_34924:233-1279(+)